MRSWPLWKLPRPAVSYLLATSIFAVALLTAALIAAPLLSAHDFERAGLLLVMAVTYAEATSRVGRLRRFLSSDGVAANANSTLTVAGMLVLPWSGALLLTGGIYLHAYVRARRHQAIRPHRFLFTTAVVVVTTAVGSAVIAAMHIQVDQVGAVDVAAIAAFVIGYPVVNAALLVPGIFLSARPPTLKAVLPSRTEMGNEISTLFIGVLAGVVVFHTPPLSPIILIVLAVWHRATLVTQLQHSARVDGKTGLLNAAAWRLDAEQALADSETASLLLIDLDHFKLVNDGYGHLTGDAALVDVAEVLRRELRGFDAVGRYGGEEFVALLPGVAGFPARLVAERLRVCISELIVNQRVRLTASIGVATTGTGIATLDELIEAADKAMYVAKSHGRDQVSPS